MSLVAGSGTRVAVGGIAVPPLADPLATPYAEIDTAVAEVAARRVAWQGLSVAGRIALLDRLIADTAAVSHRWVEVERERKRIERGSQLLGEEWFLGPWIALRGLRLLRVTLQEIERHGRPRLPGPVRCGGDGRVLARVFPTDVYDRLFFTGFNADVWMPSGVSVEEVQATIGAPYRAGAPRRSRVGVVLGAGNVSAIPFVDVICKMFVEDQVVVLKLNPITNSIGVVFGEALRALIDGGYVRIVRGGVEEGQYLVHHDSVEAVHMTGSDKTYDAIVFGTGEDASARRAQNRPVLVKPITAELGNVTPVIVVPGDWSRAAFDFHARLIAMMLTHGASNECVNARLLVTPAGWSGREQLLAALRRVLRRVANRVAFYPGVEERLALFRAAHPEAELLGAGPPGSLPWALITGVDPRSDDIVFTSDPFAPVLAETALEASSVAEYIDRAVAFCNERVWGTLGVSLIVRPRSLKDPGTAAAVRRALADLRYGTIAVNGTPAYAFAFQSSPWGAFPGHTASDIQSGRGFVHNTYLLGQAEKTVIRSPFRTFPEPAYFPTHHRADEVCRGVASLEAQPGPAKLPAIFWNAIRG